MQTNINKIKTGYYAKKEILCDYWPTRFTHRSRFKFAISLVDKFGPEKVIDYGCGDGTLIAFIHTKVKICVGIELESSLDDLKRRFCDFPNIHFYSIEGLAELKTGERPTGDLVFCTEVLEHLTELSPTLDILKTCLDDNGYLIISVPNETGLALLIKTAFRTIGSWFNVSEYKYYEKYNILEFAKMLFAAENTIISRRAYSGYYTHKGFNWRKLKTILSNEFDVCAITGTPFSFLGKCLSSQIWFILKRKGPGLSPI